MKTRTRLVVVVGTAAALLVGVGAAVVMAAGNDKDELHEVKQANKQFRDPADAQAAGWVLVEGLDHCFVAPDGSGAMGYHYINTSMLDTQLSETQPEALVYEPLPNGELKLAAVEWIVPIEPWENAGNSMPPEIHGHHLHANEALGVYVLHAWLFRNNPAGTFEDWNPKVTCP
jgi:hypothetical protein